MNKIIIAVILMVIIAGCTTSQTTSEIQTPTQETVCQSTEDLCIIGTPGLLSENSIYSSADTYFSVILRNNIQGQEASNVEVELKNVGPFKIVEGYNYTSETCTPNSTVEGLWDPYRIRDVFHSPDPSFADDLGLAYSKHKLSTMYPDEEIEFLWRLRSPSYQEIANVAYPHTFNYVISYDYKTGILQTVYVLSEEEYQRILRVEGTAPTTKGTMTSSIGPINVESSVEEPVRIQGNNSQFTLTYKVKNQRNGIPTKPAMFVLQVPDGVEHAGRFDKPRALEEEGYLDLAQAIIYYNTTGIGMEGGVCFPNSYDDGNVLLEGNPDAPIVPGSSLCSSDYKMISLSNILAYIRENFPDLDLNGDTPKLVVRFIYPNDLVSDLNYLYFPLRTTEQVAISKYYTFRLKAKYRYSFSGSDNILVVPNPENFDTSTYTPGLMWGDMKPYWNYMGSYTTPDSRTLRISKNNTVLESYFRNMGEATNTFLHVVNLTNYNPTNRYVSCSADSDCGLDYCREAGATTGTKCTVSTYSYYCSSALISADKICSTCLNATCTPISINGDYYSVDIGYNTAPARINMEATTGSSLIYVPVGKSLIFFNEFPYSKTSATTINERTNSVNHKLNNQDILAANSLEQLQTVTTNFINGRAFFEVNQGQGLLLSDNDPIQTIFDNNNAVQTTSLNILSSTDNETMFRFSPTLGASPATSTELIGVHYSPILSSEQDTLIVYFFNDEALGTYHTFTFNVSIMNSSMGFSGRSLEQNVVKVYDHTILHPSVNPTDTDSRTINGGNYLKYTLSFSSSNIVNCAPTGTNVPILIISWLDEKRSSDGTVISEEHGDIIIGQNVESDKAKYGLFGLNTAQKFYNGVVNICYSE
ncbi:Uncharacterised protein [Candidatus Tiddalikarchaeum anstoanum]|nr:Uncharacterised protein [Candidatus Tiddalikarchaeum anstoanum]